jgi:hypothetical protein
LGERFRGGGDFLLGSLRALEIDVAEFLERDELAAEAAEFRQRLTKLPIFRESYPSAARARLPRLCR